MKGSPVRIWASASLANANQGLVWLGLATRALIDAGYGFHPASGGSSSRIAPPEDDGRGLRGSRTDTSGGSSKGMSPHRGDLRRRQNARAQMTRNAKDSWPR